MFFIDIAVPRDVDPAMKAPTPKTGDSSVIQPPNSSQAK